MNDLIESIKDRNAVLFIGAGISKNIGLPTFSELIDNVAEELNFDPELFHMCGDYPSLVEYYYIIKGSIGELSSYMDTTWHDSRIDISKSEIHKKIVELNFPIIYTTNYDNWIERAYDYYKKQYVKITNVSDIASISATKTQIVKFHGDLSDAESIVLTESSYFERMNFESPLDIKLRSDVLGKTVLFIGYSLNDMNVRYLLYKLNRQWENASYKKYRPKSYIFLGKPNVIQEEILKSRGIQPILSESDNLAENMNEFLEKLKRDAGIASF